MSTSDASSAMIFFITSTIVATAVAGGLTAAVMSFTGKIDVKGKALGESLTTDITIINDPKSVTWSASPSYVWIYVKNTGSRTLNQTQIDVIVNGQYAAWTWSKTDDTAPGDFEWTSGTVVKLNVTAPTIASGLDHSVRVVTDYGRNADFRFHAD